MSSFERLQSGPETFLEKQPDYWQKVPPDQVPTGAVVPLSLILEYVQPAERQVGLDLGCGTGKKTLLLMERGFTMLGLDISNSLIEAAKSRATEFRPDGPIFFQVGDATRLIGLDPKDACSLIELVELFRFINLEALLCNLVGEDFIKAVNLIDYYLEPGGYVFIADCLRCDLTEFDAVLHEIGLDEQAMVEFHQHWEHRYAENAQIGLPDGHFVVARSGENKASEWGKANVLQELANSSLFERLARHFYPNELIAPFKEVGMELIKWQPTVFYSRSHQTLIGCLAVFQKSDCYKYTPGLKGQPSSSKEDFLTKLAVENYDEKLWLEWNRLLARIQTLFGWPVWLEFMRNTLKSE